MLRRVLALGIGLMLLVGCGARVEGQPASTTDRRKATAARTVGPGDAESAFGVLAELDEAWRKRDCAKVRHLTTAAENVLGDRACEATRHGRRVPSRPEYGDVRFYLPDTPDDVPWFVALASEPHPAYFLLVREDDRWRVAYGPVRLVGEASDLDADVTTRVVPSDDPDDGVAARLVPQKHLAFLADHVGLSGVRFPAGDAMKDLLAELVKKPSTVRPDRLSSDVRLIPGETRALALADGGALVFHALEILHTQKSGSGKLRHPIAGTADMRAFTGKPSQPSLHVTEIFMLATEVDPDGGLRTVAMTRHLSDVTT
ncbi:hypothetical protein [Sphaerisporangium sp. TRM90804]|uniref:hypothetical protein n=1 Tax=Sphaerisporangium sp. TRM90804 TaxID=3031113 RepID=UPI0024497F63|nr:hypothetical protein [Sphaerisporangium sp. TRM90804]MDH2423979.1 hypothetical protein [Sphaerisporangium sp. TRM90804]